MGRAAGELLAALASPRLRTMALPPKALAAEGLC